MTVQQEEPEQAVTPIAGEQAGEYGDGKREAQKSLQGTAARKG